MNRLQRTVEAPSSYEGIGLHTGNPTIITFLPAPINSGISFVRKDLPGSPGIPALIDYVSDSLRGTTLKLGGVSVHTVEHVLAALAGLQIDNVTVELSSNEPPVGDGSAKPFVDAILKVGIEEQDSPKDYLVIESPIFYSELKEKEGVELVAIPSEDFSLTLMVDYQNPTLGAQYTAFFSLEDDFIKGYAPARTFCFLHEVEELKRQGLIKGGSLENAIVICDQPLREDELSELKDLFGLQGKVFIGKNGVLNDIPLRYSNEPCRHKALDLLGDLCLLGRPLKAHVLAARSGHRANVAFVKRIREVYIKNLKRKPTPKRLSTTSYSLDINAIHSIMRHRYPFLLVDRVLKLEEGKSVVAIKNVTINEPFFDGHFPSHPIMPGVLIVEAMAQAGGLLLLNTVENPGKKLLYFMGIDKVRFRKPVFPGDQLRFEVEMLQFRRGTCKMAGKAYVDGNLVTEAELMATVVER